MGAVEAARAIEPLCKLWCIPGVQGRLVGARVQLPALTAGLRRLLRRVDDHTQLLRKLMLRVGLGEKLNIRVELPVMNDGVPGVAGGEGRAGWRSAAASRASIRPFMPWGRTSSVNRMSSSVASFEPPERRAHFGGDDLQPNFPSKPTVEAQHVLVVLDDQYDFAWAGLRCLPALRARRRGR